MVGNQSIYKEDEHPIDNPNEGFSFGGGPTFNLATSGHHQAYVLIHVSLQFCFKRKNKFLISLIILGMDRDTLTNILLK